MVYYCGKCRKTHGDEELCPVMAHQMKKTPALLEGAANFTNIAGQYHLVTSQSLDAVAQRVNSVIGTNLRLEGTHQFARDIQVFNRLNTETYKNHGGFRTPEAAKQYLKNATKGQFSGLKAKIVGAGQETDWLRMKQGEMQSVIERSNLLNGNAVGVDGEIVTRFTGDEIARVTVKGASTMGGVNTGAKGIVEALKKGTLAPNETVFATEGMKAKLDNMLSRNIEHALKNGDTKTAELLTKAKESLKVIEHGSIQDTAEARDRILDKIRGGKALTCVTPNEALSKAAQGAAIGAAIGLTVSSITNFIKYKNGDLSIQEAFTNIGEDSLKSALMGGTMGTITLFLPGGAVGFAAGLAIGMYLNAALTNILDEIFGKGAYAELLTASGYVMGTSMNLSEAMAVFVEDRKAVQASLQRIEYAQAKTKREINKFNQTMKVL